MLTLAGSLNSTGDFPKAESFGSAALKIIEHTFNPNHPQIQIALNSISDSLREQGKFSRSLDLDRRAFRIASDSFGPQHPSTADAINALTRSLLGLGRYVEAERAVKKSLVIREKTLGINHPDTIDSLHNLTRVLEKQFRRKEAYAVSSKGIDALRQRFDAISSLSSAELDQERRSNRRFFLSHLDLSLHPDNGVSRADGITKAFEMAQWAQSSSAGKAIARMSQRFAVSSDALGQVVRRGQDLRNQLAATDKALINSIMKPPKLRNPQREANLRNKLDELKSSLAETERRISSQFPRYAELASPVTLLPKEAQALLLTGEALIVINQSYDENKTHVFMLRDDAYSVHTVDLSAAAIKDAVQILRKGIDLSAIQSLADLPSFDTLVAHNLYLDLLGPIEKSLSGVEHVFWVLDGALQSLPPGLLVAEKPFQVGNYTEVAWLTKRFASTTLPSVSSLKALRAYAKRSTARDPFIGFGDPKLEGPNGSNKGKIDYARLIRGFVAQPSVLKQSFSSLPDTADELRGIASALGANKDSIYLAEQATETRVRTTKLDKFKIVAFATHGLMAGEQAGLAEPALVLTPPEEATFKDDGLLSASEIAQLTLNADWVLLSACNTASGNASNAQSLSGLAKAFFYAGSRSLLVSHWPVESRATVALITRMFRLIANDNSIGRSEALRQSKLSMISDKDNEHWAHPAFWAPFVVVGEGKRS